MGDAPKSMTHFKLVSDGLREAINDDGIFKPINVFDVLNQLQKAEDPNAYKPEIVQMIERKQEREKREDEEKKKKQEDQNNKKRQASEHERALFDFDEEINYLD